MALRQRAVEVNKIDRENLTARPGKPQLQKVSVTSRPALGEVGNKIQVQVRKNTNFKNPISLKSEVSIVKKCSIEEKKSSRSIAEKKGATKIKVEKVIKTETTVTTNVVKRETVVLKHIVNAGDDCQTEEEVSYSTKQLIGISDVDNNDKNNPVLVSEYILDIYKYLREVETEYPIRQNFLSDHRSTPRMRAVLVNWMVEVHMNFKFLLETLHLSIAILDRYLQVEKNVGRETLQLVGTAAMLLAGKYEEMYVPDITDFVYICDDTFSHKEILKMEGHILKKLDFNFGRPLPLHFLRRYNKIARVQPEHHSLGKYLLELALMEYELCHINPSVQAAAACCLSLSILNDVSKPSSIWSKTLIYYTGYTFADIKPMIISMACAIEKAETSKYQVIRKKYAASNHGKISLNPKLKGSLIKNLVDASKVKV